MTAARRETSMPRVGLTTTAQESGGSYGRPSVFLYESYIAALQAVGIAPVLLTPSHDAGAVRALLSVCDGLLLSGGEDVDPARYGEKPSPALGAVNRRRDAMEFCALEAALDRQIPIFGICRGLQVLNVALGGTLYQDIATQHPDALLHRQTEPWGTRSHQATVAPGSRLHAIVETDELFINSYHHQAIREVAPGLAVVARAEDGMIEAVEGRDHPWLLGVQWHPERYEATTPETDPDRRLFHAFAGVLYGDADASLAPADLSRSS